jgi:hypothetical protein
MAIWRDDVVTALENLGGQGTLEQIYAGVAAIRNERPETWQAIVRRELEYNSSDSESHQERYDLFYSVNGLGKGVWGLRKYEPKTPQANDLIEPETTRVETTVYRILRDTLLARRIKKLYNNECQICGLTIELRDQSRYSEAHHIQPLGQPHNGPDVAENIVVLCPNHHAQLDFGTLKIEKNSLGKCAGHDISEKYIKYHNEKIFSET